MHVVKYIVSIYTSAYLHACIYIVYGLNMLYHDIKMSAVDKLCLQYKYMTS